MKLVLCHNIPLRSRSRSRSRRRQTAEVYRLPSTAYRLPSTAYRLPSTAYRLPPTVYRLPSTVYRLPSTVYRLATVATDASQSPSGMLPKYNMKNAHFLFVQSIPDLPFIHRHADGHCFLRRYGGPIQRLGSRAPHRFERFPLCTRS